MEATEKKEQFVLLRAEGLSYAKIADQLHISKSTCNKWENELKTQITTAREDRLTDLYTLYRIGREAYIEKLGKTLERIDNTLSEKDLSEIPADKLLKLKLEYEEKLQEQRVESTEGVETFKEYKEDEVLEATIALYEKVKSGSITAQQAKAELTVLEEVRRAINSYNLIW